MTNTSIKSTGAKPSIMDSGYKDADVLRRMYHGEEMTTAEIADEFDCSATTIRNWMSKYGIETRSLSESKLVGDRPWTDEGRLRKLYHDEVMTAEEIGDKLGTERSNILKWMERHGIERRSSAESRELRGTHHRPTKDGPHTDPEWLEDRYHGDGLSLSEMADEAGLGSEVTILRQMQRHNIPRRDLGEHLKKEGSVTVQKQYPRMSIGGEKSYPLHRLVAVGEFGLDRVGDSVVHHKNGVIWDNRPENLEVLDSQSEHATIHNRDKGRDEYGRFV